MQAVTAKGALLLLLQTLAACPAAAMCSSRGQLLTMSCGLRRTHSSRQDSKLDHLHTLQSYACNVLLYNENLHRDTMALACHLLAVHTTIPVCLQQTGVP
jgi:hypothetical protein